MKTFLNRFSSHRPALLTASLVAALATACAHPEARLADFEDNSPGAEKPERPGPDGEPLDELPDVTGQFFFTLVPAGIGLNIYFIATHTVTLDDAGGGTIDISLQALSVDGQEPVGDPIASAALPISANGGFVADFGSVIIPGAANPISGSEITANITLVGQLLSDQLLCGEVEGAITAPISLDLTGSTWGSQRITDAGGAFPPAVTDCIAAAALLPDEEQPPMEEPGECTQFGVAVLSDGGFDDEVSAWDQFSSRGISLVRVADEDGSFDLASELPPGLTPHSSGSALWMGGSPDATDSVSQEFNIPAAGENLTLSGFLWVSGLDDTDGDKLVLKVTRAGQSVGTAVVWSADMGPTNGWIYFSTLVEADIGGDTIKITLESTTDGAKNTNFFIDSLQAATDVCL